MTISVNQQVDYLWKKLGYGVAKTETPANKDATNESIISSPFIPGDKIWAESDQIPNVIPSTHGPVVHVHSQSNATAVQCIMDVTASANRTWLTGHEDWIPIEFGSTYQVKVYLDTLGSSTPQTTGIQLYAAGSGNNDEWFFDYEAGLLHFIGDELPNYSWQGKRIFVCGARYVGRKGLHTFASSTIGNITISGDTISSVGNINLLPTGSISASGYPIRDVAYPTLPTDVATYQFVVDEILALHPNTIYQGDSIIRLSDPTGNAGILTIDIDGERVSTWDASGANISGLTLKNSTISSLDDITILQSPDKVLRTTATTAWKIPTGTSSERPSIPEPGYIRYNINLGSLEFFNGTAWVGPQQQIDSQVIVGDGVTTHFNLNQSSFENNLLVTIQGVTQVPGVAYTVNGNIITFSETPLNNERIEIRFISQSVTPILPAGQITPTSVVDPASVSIGITPTVVDSFAVSLYRAAKYIASISTADHEYQMAEIMVAHNGYVTTNSVVMTPMTGTSTTAITFTTQINLGACELLATSTDAGTTVKLQKVYITV